jgi:excisionase family DNA binding protein
MRPLLTVADVAELLAIPQHTVRQIIRHRDLPAVNVGTPRRPIYRVEPAALEAFLEQRRTCRDGRA